MTFYAAGETQLLRQAWAFLRDRGVKLKRTRRLDLFTGKLDVMAVTVADPAYVRRVYRALSERFPTLVYYDADIPLNLRFVAKTNVYMLGRCRVRSENGWIFDIEAMNTPWELDPISIPLRIMHLEPDVDPSIQRPTRLKFQHGREKYRINLEPRRPLMIGLDAAIRRYDPDLILTEYGDTWLFQELLDSGFTFNPNRDPKKEVLVRQANSYFAYGQIVYRGAQAHLFGRWHIDKKNALLFNEIGLEGALELARVTGMGVQEAARKSPGAGITAMQLLTALRSDVLVPVTKQQVERRKSLKDLVSADRGGLIYQPIVGVHKNVAQIDFTSMYPAIIVKHNISPETISNIPLGQDRSTLLQNGRDGEKEGLVPKTLRPLLEKRVQLKQRLMELNPRDCRVKTLKDRATALKWLLVVCFGYLGYKNARFGQIESHEAVTTLNRELMMQAKEVAEDMGFEVLHMYIDCLFVRKDGLREQKDFSPLLEAIQAQIGIPIVLDGIYKWLVFPASKRDGRTPVPNRYFGAFTNGELKYRGVALRRHDTCRFVAETQLGVLKILAQTDHPEELVPQAYRYVERQVQRLKAGKVPLDDLRVAKKLSRELEAYRTPSPA
ncbi:MAG: DNA polymerase domain-containing protein [Anaerolineales bacterium]